MTERDYGVDCYVEIVSERNEMIGEVFLAQLKGTSVAIEWSKTEVDGKKHFTFSGVEGTTVNYWWRLPVPVFLFIADCNSRRVYFSNVRAQVRSHYDKFLAQDNFGFRIEESSELRTEIGDATCQAQYLFEKRFPEFMSEVDWFLGNWRRYNFNHDTFVDNSEFFVGDPDEVPKKYDYLLYYNRCKELGRVLGVDWDSPSLTELYQEFKAKPGFDYWRIHDLPVYDYTARENEILWKLLPLILRNERAYWKNEIPSAFMNCQAVVEHRSSDRWLFPDGKLKQLLPNITL